MSRPKKKMLPVLGQAPQEQEGADPRATHGDVDGCADDCCSGPEASGGKTAATPSTREANPEASGETATGVLERTVVRVEGMDCASCAATVEKTVSALPGVSRATVNFAAGRLDAEHDPGLSLQELEGAIRTAGYGVAETEEAERVIVRPGERLAVDGRVLEGSSAVDEAPVTGESVPVEKGVGDAVYSGSLNGQGGLLVQTTKKAGASTLQKITRLVEEAQATKAPAEQFVDRFSRVYTPVVVTVGVVLAVVPPLLGGGFGEWFYRALALLIIACPCALVISTPVTVVSGIGAASRRGILVKGGAALEAAGRLKALAFDKTGTLTEGRPIVSRTVALGGRGEAEVLALAAALERRSEHPLAHAILSAGASRAVDGAGLPPVANFRSVSGRGAEGEVLGRKYLIGSTRLFEERGISLSPAREALAEAEREGETPVILGNESEGPLAVFGLADSLRPDARATVESLRGSGVEELVMLTGDAEAPARRVAEELGVGYRARLLPEQKIEAVSELVEKHGDVGMVGDGVNDAPALAASSVGFAMGAAGTDVALDTADVALMQDDLPKLAEAVKLSRAAERIIKQNVAVSIAIKGLFVVLAPFGLVALWLAVLADMGTSIAVTLNGLRLFGKGAGLRGSRSAR